MPNKQGCYQKVKPWSYYGYYNYSLNTKGDPHTDLLLKMYKYVGTCVCRYIVVKCPGLAGRVPIFDPLSWWCPGLVFVPDFTKRPYFIYS